MSSKTSLWGLFCYERRVPAVDVEQKPPLLQHRETSAVLASRQALRLSRLCYNALMKRSSKQSTGFAGWSKAKKIVAGIGLYLAAGLIWSLVMLATSGGGGDTAPGTSAGSIVMSVVVTSILWLPLWLISSL